MSRLGERSEPQQRTATATAFANTTYAFYLANDTSGTNIPALGAYGYANGVAWAVLDHTADGVVSEFAVIPEPDTYAMLFSGFGLLFAFRRVRRRFGA